ncbi:hypothetical protein LIER_20564 [Lithospermum erythrorhizon]|uniref:Ent-kaurene synthase n=1 Tax=Lithospermum erythrorhizon TaxID=34254 RepID=A0AAV3QN02_LITER
MWCLPGICLRRNSRQGGTGNGQNGSFINSPSTTAAALTPEFGIRNLEEEEIVEDASTCTLAFRLLRNKGYAVSSDPLLKFLEKDIRSNLNYGQLNDINTILELYRASEMVIHQDEGILEKFNSRTKSILEQWLSNECLDASGLNFLIRKQVDDVLKFPFHVDLQLIRSRRNIEHCGLNNTRALKPSYCLLNLGDKDFITLGAEDFKLGQYVHHDEFAYLERWVTDNTLDKLKFARQKSAYCYFSAAATLVSPELSDARMSWAKNCVLTTVIDDFSDVGGTIGEMKNLIELVERWDVSNRSDCCSEQVEIMFSALKHTIFELGEKTLAWQSQDETNHIIQIVSRLYLFSMSLLIAEWARSMSVPTLDEYISNILCFRAIVLPALYFIGPKLPKDAVRHSDVQNLLKLLSTCGRLLNDIQGFERESKQGKLNAVTLDMIHGIGGQTQEEVLEELRHQINRQRRDLLRLVLQGNDSVLPRECRDLFWNMSQVLHLFYSKDDRFTSKEMNKSVGTILFEPLSSALTE